MHECESGVGAAQRASQRRACSSARALFPWTNPAFERPSCRDAPSSCCAHPAGGGLPAAGRARCGGGPVLAGGPAGQRERGCRLKTLCLLLLTNCPTSARRLAARSAPSPPVTAALPPTTHTQVRSRADICSASTGSLAPGDVVSRLCCCFLPGLSPPCFRHRCCTCLHRPCSLSPPLQVRVDSGERTQQCYTWVGATVETGALPVPASGKASCSPTTRVPTSAAAALQAPATPALVPLLQEGSAATPASSTSTQWSPPPAPGGPPRRPRPTRPARTPAKAATTRPSAARVRGLFGCMLAGLTAVPDGCAAASNS